MEGFIVTVLVIVLGMKTPQISTAIRRYLHYGPFIATFIIGKLCLVYLRDNTSCQFVDALFYINDDYESLLKIRSWALKK